MILQRFGACNLQRCENKASCFQRYRRILALIENNLELAHRSDVLPMSLNFILKFTVILLTNLQSGWYLEELFTKKRVFVQKKVVDSSITFPLD